MSPHPNRLSRAVPWLGLALVLTLVPGDRPRRAPLTPADPKTPPPAAPAQVPSSTVLVRLERPPAGDMPASGVLRVETDDGTLVREAEIQGDTVEIADLPDGPYVLRLQARGYARVSRAIRTPSAEVVLALEPMASVAGRVQGPSGEPHAGRVRIVGSGIWPGRFLDADPNGNFVIENVPPGVYEVEVTSGSLVAEARRGLTIRGVENVFLGFTLAEGGVLEGQVVDRSTGRPIAGAEIVASTEALSANARAALSDATGAFRAGPFAPGPVVLDVRAAGFVPATATACRTDAPCRVALAAGASLRGRVLDADRQPIADAWVEVLGEASDHAPIAVSATATPLAPLLFAASPPPALATTAPPADLTALAEGASLGVTSEVPPLPLIASGEPAPPLDLAPGAATLPAPAATVVRTSLRTDAEGAFAVGGLPPGRVEIIARAPGYRAARSARLQLTAGRERDGVELVLDVGGRVTARVIDEHGRPADARVEARIEGDPVPRYLQTDARGELVLEDVGGTVLLLATAEGRPPTEAVVTVGPAATARVTLALDAGRRTLRALVVDPRGTPLPDALVRLETLTAGTGQPRTLVTDENGEIALAAAPPGALLLSAAHARFSPSGPTVVEGDEVAVLTLSEPLRLETSLLDAWSGAGIAEADVTFTCLDAAPCFRQATSGPEGALDLHRARPGRYRVEVRAAGYATLVEELAIRAPRRGEVIELDPLVLEPALTLEGDVVDPFGRVAEDAEVSIVISDDRDGRIVRTDERGHFRLDGIPAGRRTLLVEHATGGTVTLPLDVRRDRDPAPVVVHLPARIDGDPALSDRARRTIGVGVTLREASGVVVIDQVVTPGARRLGLLPGDELLSIDGVDVSGLADATRRIEGPSLVPALVTIRRAGRSTPLRAPREPGPLGRP